MDYAYQQRKNSEGKKNKLQTLKQLSKPTQGKGHKMGSNRERKPE